MTASARTRRTCTNMSWSTPTITANPPSLPSNKAARCERERDDSTADDSPQTVAKCHIYSNVTRRKEKPERVTTTKTKKNQRRKEKKLLKTKIVRQRGSETASAATKIEGNCTLFF